MLEDLIAYAAVACATIYASWRLLPTTIRFSLAEYGVTLAQFLGFSKPDAEGPRRRLEARAKGACGGCSGCASKQTPQQVISFNRKDS
ncbi:hypothetical protein [Accumulibacter sp.]|uniref:hypothetical protein n=1 Tax=Accumulibacter sp. TaxID=2053492 RepID=UPI0028C47006|nr:hypothetical protein [Accumulibacter sp.]